MAGVAAAAVAAVPVGTEALAGRVGQPAAMAERAAARAAGMVAAVGTAGAMESAGLAVQLERETV